VLQHAVELPFERAAELLADITGLALSNHLSHDTVQQVAEIADLDNVWDERRGKVARALRTQRA